MSANGEGQFKEGETYNVVVESVVAAESANRGTPFFDFKLKVADGEMEGETLHYEAYATEGRKERLLAELKLLGFDPEKTPWTAVISTITGKECAVVLKQETWNGRTRLKVDRLRQRGASEAEGGVIGKIAALFGAQVAPAVEKSKDERVPF
jgi:hypothetical protein